jgi:hypothetical protein
VCYAAGITNGLQGLAARAILRDAHMLESELIDKTRVNDDGITPITPADTQQPEMGELETSTARLVARDLHLDAAQALREFASQIVDTRDGGPIWLSESNAG